MTDRLHVAVVGGGIRGRMYGAVVQEHPGSTLVGVCETAPAASAAVAEQFAVPVRASLAELLEHVDAVDAVIVATPDFAHREAGELALSHGLHTLFEKPLATTVEDARALRDARPAGVHSMVGFENRWNPSFQSVRAALHESGEAFLAQRAALQDTHWVPREMLAWSSRSTPAWFLMPHSLDMAMWLSGSTPVEVFARGVRTVLAADGIDTWDRVSASFVMSDGSLVTLDSGWALPTGRPAVFDFRFEVETRAGHYLVDVDRSGVTRVTDTGLTYLGPPEHDLRGRLRGAPVEMTRDFIDLCRGADVDVPSLDHGVTVTTAIEALHRSLATGQNIRIDD
ncbi:Gfo/Idh/MocA family oxidoreductase [Phycicoccus endophyticus]|uniref:Gfo/Idh/MocA family oxidoreductase n=1 Tax=Phycicoccus endophyticus TaxID=1690220 RepID=A0A7G9QZX8_9MICO|nr:Gfo/Idh/MocA family oxidoreductase [Phycicoccus endophyticus]NHI20757.1 Gfo/Idh/MocA family oxidoreductase [Phycicoccus endophyticus]QNN48903.1 Gfo/Idh/MocA family oxidoreductase [Phycicoccus endophyticus]GGL43693.1 dehydrogenase [Phycicoccus endophyticus]